MVKPSRTNETEAREEAESAVRISAPPVVLEGSLALPARARGVVLFAHGSGSSRLSPRNRYVAEVLHRGGIGTLLFDLLTPEEEELDERSAQLRFDIPFLANRLIAATDWILAQPESRLLALGYFGASTGGGAALAAAAERPRVVAAVVSRGGRPDLAGEALARVQAATLLIVGGEDAPVIRMNQNALRELHCKKRLKIVPGATHLFEEPGTLEAVARLARDWFAAHFERSLQPIT